MELHHFIQTIKTKEDFVYFVEMFRKDYEKNKDDINQWENTTLEQFLNGLSGYANSLREKDPDGAILPANQPSWKLFADILMGAAVYE